MSFYGLMNRIKSIRNLGICIATGILSLGTATAQLPSLSKGDFIGRFAGISGNRFDWGMDPNAKGELRPYDDKKKQMGIKFTIPTVITVEETLPDGKIIQRQIDIKSLTTDDKPTEKFEKLTFRGKVTSGAEFEIVIEQTRGSIHYGGRLISPSKDTKNKQRLMISSYISPIYEAADRTDKAFLRSVSGDVVKILRADGSRYRAKTNDLIENFKQDGLGLGIRQVEVHFDGYRGRDFEFIAHGASTIEIYQRVTAPLNTGFTVQWSPDPDKDADMSSRFEIKVK